MLVLVIKLVLDQPAAAPDRYLLSIAPAPVCSNRSVIVDQLTAFGAAAVAAMLVCYALEWRSSWFVLAFGGACVASAVYGFLVGAWPFGVVESIWSLVALRRWWKRRRRDSLKFPPL